MNNIHTVSLILNIGQRDRARKARWLSIDFSDGPKQSDTVSKTSPAKDAGAGSL
jgi:hypothetical protein